MPDYLLFSDSSTNVQLEPEFDFQNRSEKIQSTLRTQDGGLKQYKYGSFAAFNVPVKYMTESAQLKVHEWWLNNTDLKFDYQGSLYDVRIVNKRTPVDKFVKPYDDLYQGKIKLGGF